MQDYLLIVMMLSFLVHLLLLLGANRLCGFPPGGIRVVLSAVLAAVHAGACLASGFSFLGGMIWRLAFLLLQILLAFGMRRDAIRRGLLFIILSLAVEGITTGGGWAVILAASVIYLLCFVSGHRPAQQYAPVTITHAGSTLSLLALRDTGNTLADPISGAPVVIVGQDAAWQLLGLTQQQLAHPIETITSFPRPGLRLIPYCAVGQSAGLLLGCRVDRLQINGKESDAIVAFAPQTIGQKATFQALTGGYV